MIFQKKNQHQFHTHRLNKIRPSFVCLFFIIIHTGKSIEKMMETIQSIFLQLDRPTDSRLKHRQEKADCQTGKTGSNYTVTAEV